MSNRPLRIDWNRIKQIYTTDETVILTMTRRASVVLLSLMDILEWEATFRVEGYDYSDWDELQAILSEADYELGVAMPLSQLIQYIDEVESLLRALQVTANCCDSNSDISGGDQYTDVVDDGTGNVPQNIIDAGYASGSSDWAGFDDYKCMIAHVTIDTLVARLRKLAPYVDAAGAVFGGIATIAAIVTAIFTGGLSALATGIIAITGSAAILYQAITDGSILEAIADDIETNRDELVCSIYQADGTANVVQALFTKVDELFDAGSALIIKNLNVEPTVKALYSGRHDQQNIAQKLADAGYDTTDFNCICAQQYDHTALIDFAGGTSIINWNPSVGGVTSFVDNDMKWYFATHPQTITHKFAGTSLNTAFALGMSSAYYVRKIEFDYYFQKLAATNFDSGDILRVQVTPNGGSTTTIWTATISGHTVNTWYKATLEGSGLGPCETQRIDWNNWSFWFNSTMTNHHTANLRFKVDNVTFYIDE